MKLLIVDTETTDINDAKVCEIAGTLYHVGKNVRETGAICSVSTVLPVTENPAEFVNGISPELTLNAPGWIAPTLLGTLKKMADVADYAVAFNAEFDAPLVSCQLLGIINFCHETEPQLATKANELMERLRPDWSSVAFQSWMIGEIFVTDNNFDGVF